MSKTEEMELSKISRQQNAFHLSSTNTLMTRRSIESKINPKNYEKKYAYFDKQHLENQNYMLRTKIKQLQENNMHSKTKILQIERQMVDNVRGNSRNKSSFIRESSSLKSIKFNVKKMEKHALTNILTNEDQQQANQLTLSLKKLIRQQKQKITDLKNQNETLKKSLKMTRINQIEIENKLVLQENQRLAKVARNIKNLFEQTSYNYQKEIKNLKQAFRKQKIKYDKFDFEISKVEKKLADCKLKDKNYDLQKRQLKQQNLTLKGEIAKMKKQFSELNIKKQAFSLKPSQEKKFQKVIIQKKKQQKRSTEKNKEQEKDEQQNYEQEFEQNNQLQKRHESQVKVEYEEEQKRQEPKKIEQENEEYEEQFQEQIEQNNQVKEKKIQTSKEQLPSTTKKTQKNKTQQQQIYDFVEDQS